MKTYLKLDRKLGPKAQPQSDQFRPTQPDTNPHVRKDYKATEKRKRLIPTRKYKLKVVVRPNSSNVTAQPHVTNPKAPENTEGQKPSTEGTPGNNPLPLENAPVHTSTPWPEAGKMSGNLFELRKDWPILPTNNTVTPTNSKPPIKIEPKVQEQPIPGAAPPPKAEQCGWGLNCPICKNIEEDWDGENQKQFQQNTKNTQIQEVQQQKNPSQIQDAPQAQNSQCSETQNCQVPQNFQCTWMQLFNVLDRYVEQIHFRREWEEKMEKLNEKYGLDYFSDSELDPQSNEGENYRYEHNYETLI